MPSGPAPLTPTGRHTSHGCSWASGLPLMKILASLQPSCSTVPLWSFLASFLVFSSHCQWFSTSPRGPPHHISPPGVPVPPRSLQKSLISSRAQLLSIFAWRCQTAAHTPLQRAICRGFQLFFFILELGERHESVSVNRLKPHAGPSIFTPASAPLGGCPPLSVAPPSLPPGEGGGG